MSLETGKLIHGYHWEDSLPITESVIERVEELSSCENMPLLQNVSLIFEWSPCVPVDDKWVIYEKLRGDNINDEKSNRLS